MPHLPPMGADNLSNPHQVAMPADAAHNSSAMLSTDPILTVDQDSAIVAANAAACRMLGESEEALMGAPFLARVVGEERQAAQVLLADGLCGKAAESSLLLQCDHAEVRRVRIRLTPVTQDGDTPRLLLALHAPTAPREVESFHDVVRAARSGLDTPRTSARRVTGDGQQPTVLVIDDDSALRTVMRLALEPGGYRVLEATSGRHALAQLREGHAVDLVVTDLKMEDGSGGWLLAQLAYEHPELVGCTLVMAGDTEDVGAAHVASRWRCPVLRKPFSGDQLLNALASLSRTNSAQNTAD
jgi:PAS domain S-box-containing protein